MKEEQKMRFGKIKTRIIATAFSGTTVLSCFGLTAFAAAPDPKEVVKDLTGYTVEKVIGLVPGGDIVQDLLNKGAGYILDWAFGEDEGTDNSPSIQDVIDELDTLSTKIDDYHNEKMGHLKLINANINTKEFRKEADSIADDYEAAIDKIKMNSGNIKNAGTGVIDTTTYRAYKNILSGKTCNPSILAKNFNIMKEFVCGKRNATDKQPGYKLTSEYLLQKVTGTYKETEHDWVKSLDYLQLVQDINGEIESMHANAVLDCITILALNDMAYKVREYEIKNGIYEPTEKEDPYSSYRELAAEVAASLAEMDNRCKEIVKTNNENHELVQAVVELSDPVGGKKVKGFNNFEEAWAQAYMTDKDFNITGYQDVKAVKKYGFNAQNLDWGYGYTALPCGHRIKKGRSVTVDMTGHTFDGSAENKNVEVFGLEDNTKLTLKNAKIVNCMHSILVKEKNNVTCNLENVEIKDTTSAAILYRSQDSKNMELHLKNCDISGTKAGSAVRLASMDTVYTVDGCNFENNTGTSGGGAINCPSLSNKNVVTNSTFTKNFGKGYGGAINTKKAKVTNCKFIGNRSEFKGTDQTGSGNKGAGGAIAADHLICDRCTFRGNSTNDQAGAIIIWDVNCTGKSTFSITNCEFINNTSVYVGGAIRVFKVGTNDQQVIKDCTFNGNWSMRGTGAFIESTTNAFHTNLYKNWNNKGSEATSWGFFAYQKN